MNALLGKDWEVIVVGAGSAGAALAARLAERGKQVLLLEAGPDYRSAEMLEVWRSPNPIRALKDPNPSPYVWRDLMATRTDAQGPALYWRGRGLGGSSSVNGQIAIRPTLEEYDDWAMEGCKGWSGQEVLPYFNRLESDQDYGDMSYHGDSGPIPIYRTKIEDWGTADTILSNTAQSYGFGWTDDINAPSAEGVSRYPINSRDHRRVNTNDAYLEPLRGNDKLTIVGHAIVDRVLFAGTDAIGVSAIVDGEVLELRGEEIVICAGVTHSPAILIRSGIGLANRLKELGCAVKSNLPVGEGMQDHPCLFFGLSFTDEAAIQSLDDRHTNVSLRYTSSVPGAKFNDMQITSMNQAVLAMEHADLSRGAGAIGVWLNEPASRGQVLVNSLDPTAMPFVRENMLSLEHDRARMREGVRILRTMLSARAVDSYCQVPVSEANVGLFDAMDAGDEALDAFLLANVGDTQHGTSTCRMGSEFEETTVVDPDCKVLGIGNLRVADASVFPYTSRANTHLASVMVGERVADFIAPVKAVN